MTSHASVPPHDAMPGIGRGRSHLQLAALCALGAILLLLSVAASAGASDPVFQSSFDGSTTPAGSMSPGRLAVDESTGDVYVIDTAHDAIDVFSSSGTYLSQIRGSSTTAGSFSFGGDDDIAVDNSGGANDGNVYVNSENGSFGGTGTFAFDRNGAFLWQSGGFSDECGIAVDPTNGNLWGADFGSGLHQIDPTNGGFIGQFTGPSGDSCHFAIDTQGNVDLNHWNGAIEKFDFSGNSLVSFPSNGQAYTDVAVDTASNDAYGAGSHVIAAWHSDGTAISSGFGPVGLGVTVNSASRLLYVTVGSTVQIFRIIDQDTVRATLTGTGSGTVRSNPISIDCTTAASPCSARFDEGSPVVLTATPDTGSELAGWTGCDSVSVDGTQCTVTPSGSEIDVSAQFDLVPRHLTVNVVGPGSVTSAPAGISCPSGCDGDFPANDLVALTATADDGATFAGWSDDCASFGTSSACQLTMDADKTVTATFTQNPPTVSDPVGTPTSSTTATLRANVNPNNDATTCEFEFGTTTAYGTTVPCATDPGSGTTAVPVSVSLTGLTPGATYHFRIDATNTGGTTRGDDATFTMPFPAPTATTGGASGISQTGATLGGSVNPNGAATTCTFQYGTSTAYGSSVPCASAPGSGSSAVAVSAAVSGLSAGTTYHYRVVATSSGGTTNGGDQTFTTTATSPPPPTGEPTLPATASVKGTVAILAIGCRGDAGATCRGTVKLTAKVKVKGRRGKRAKARTIVVGTGSYDLTVGGTEKVKVHLSKAARAALRKSSLRAKATAGDVTRTLTVKKPKARRKHRK